MKIFIKIIFLSMLSFMLIACDERETSPVPVQPVPPNSPGSPWPKPEVNCRQFQDYYVVYLAMRDQTQLLATQAQSPARVALSSAIFAEHLRSSYLTASQMSDYTPEVQATYLKFYNWTFDSEGWVRPRPLHPHTQYCLGKV